MRAESDAGGGAPASSLIREASELQNKADKAMRGGVFSFLTGGPRYDDAAQLYVASANKYKLAKQWPEAAASFMQASYVHQKLQDPGAEASSLVQAAQVTRRFSTSEATARYERAAALLSEMGRFSQAARFTKEVAEALEEERDLKRAREFYKKAADLFEMDDYGKSSYSQCVLKYADISAREFQSYEEAIRIYEKEGEKALRNNLIQFGAKEHFLKAGILHLVVGDAVNAILATDRYDEIDPRFAPSREGKLLRDCATAFEKKDVEAFVAAM
eukprot:GHVT01030022.1.p1 GENE.GHVT01030022.1~~GHVT01030022.1.p1  ORF type:complete len:273 (+),score=72.04 GHVT01030022.1:662-1480(+)